MNEFHTIKQKKGEALTLRTGNEKQMYLTVELQIKDEDTQKWKDKTQTGRKYLSFIYLNKILSRIYKEFLKFNKTTKKNGKEFE